MRQFPLLLALAIFFAILAQCKNKSNNGNTDTSPAVPDDTQAPAVGLSSRDTVFVRDTIYRTDTLRDAPIQPCISLSADNMNVMYIGRGYNISVAAPGFPADDISVVVSGCDSKIRKEAGTGRYFLTFRKTGEARIDVSAGTASRSFTYPVKRIPDPIAWLGSKGLQEFTAGDFKQQHRISADLDDFEFRAFWDIESFNLIYIPKGGEVVEVRNQGAGFNVQTRALVNKARSGDIYCFTNVRAKGPDDIANRLINSLVFKIR